MEGHLFTAREKTGDKKRFNKKIDIVVEQTNNKKNNQ